MRERVLTNWTFKRALYVAMGSYLIIQSIVGKQYFGVLLGSYFAAMGLFSFGCASGNCAGGSCEIEPKVKEIADK
jgi:hypothetical protein